MKSFGKRKLNIALVVVICVFCVILCGSAFADDAADKADFEETPIYIDGLLSLRGYLLGETTYIPFDTACAVLEYQLDEAETADDETLGFRIGDIEITVYKSEKYLLANGRYFFLPDGYVEIDGMFCIPIEVAAKLFTLEAVWDEMLGAYDLSTENEALLVSGDEYYNDEDLYWMSRIISYEAGNQPIEGQIGVGNVVMNRVKSDIFPDTVKKVIFQPGQFTPVARKAIFLEPFDIGIITAKMALEGCNTVGEALYFHKGTYNEKHTTQNKYFVDKIGDHNFFISIANLDNM